MNELKLFVLTTISKAKSGVGVRTYIYDDEGLAKAHGGWLVAHKPEEVDEMEFYVTPAEGRV